MREAGWFSQTGNKWIGDEIRINTRKRKLTWVMVQYSKDAGSRGTDEDADAE